MCEITNESLNQLIFILESKLTLTQFEVDLVNDTFERYKTYGNKTRLTKKVAKVIFDIYFKTKIVSLEPLTIKKR